MTEAEEGPMPVVFDLGAYGQGTPDLSQAHCANQAEAAALCFSELGHPPGVGLEGAWEPATVVWPSLDPRAAKTHEETRATEAGAEAIAIIGARAWCGFEVVARSRIGTGCDFFLQKADAESDDPFEGCHALEVSGTRQRDEKELERRIRRKRKQVLEGRAGIPALIVVVGFARPVVVIEEVP